MPFSQSSSDSKASCARAKLDPQSLKYVQKVAALVAELRKYLEVLSDLKHFALMINIDTSNKLPSSHDGLRSYKFTEPHDWLSQLYSSD